MAKNIVVFADGTGKEGGKDANSNIYKLFNMIEDRTPRQISFYGRGLGTGWWRKVGGLVGGAGISKISKIATNSSLKITRLVTIFIYLDSAGVRQRYAACLASFILLVYCPNPDQS